jgi:hypothetical protein
VVRLLLLLLPLEMLPLVLLLFYGVLALQTASAAASRTTSIIWPHGTGAGWCVRA